MESFTLEDIQRKIERLQRMNRLWGILFLLLLAFNLPLGLYAIKAFSSKQLHIPGTLTANQIMVVDKDGNSRIRLGSFSDSTTISLKDNTGRTGVYLGISRYTESFLHFKGGEENRPLITLSIDDALPRIIVSGEDRRTVWRTPLPPEPEPES